MPCRHYLLAACLCLLFGSAAHAGNAPLPGGPRIADCSKARDPARCEARIAARSACKDKRGDSKRICMDAYVVSPDCARSDNPKQCIARKKAEQACHGKQGKAFQSCVKSKLKQKK